MIIEMLLNNDVQLFFCSNDFKLSKRNKCKVYVFVMFKMKYLINRM